jgi:hypothetical protein
MNWRLVFTLSLFGLAMSIATVFVVSSRAEPFFWLTIFILCARAIARYAPQRPFMHGLMVGVVNGVWMTSGHIFFFNEYAARHQSEMEAFASAPLPPRAMMLIIGPIIGVVSGAVLGLLSILAARVGRRRA